MTAFCAPTSTSAQIEIAVTFANQSGVILDLEKLECSDTKYFNCSWISNFGVEDEKLFFGGDDYLKFYSIRNMKTNENYQYYITALELFDEILNGHYGANKKLTKYNFKLIMYFIRHYLKEKKNKFPKYVNDLFATFCINKKCINIDLVDIFSRNTKLFASVLTTLSLKTTLSPRRYHGRKVSDINDVIITSKSEEIAPSKSMIITTEKKEENMSKLSKNVYKINKARSASDAEITRKGNVINLLKFDYLTKMFPNCVSIECRMDGHIRLQNINTLYMKYLITMLDDMNKTENGLKVIKLKGIQYEKQILHGGQLKNKFEKMYKSVFKNKGWKLKVDKNEKNCKKYSDLILCRIHEDGGKNVNNSSKIKSLAKLKGLLIRRAS